MNISAVQNNSTSVAFYRQIQTQQAASNQQAVANQQAQNSSPKVDNDGDFDNGAPDGKGTKVDIRA